MKKHLEIISGIGLAIILFLIGISLISVFTACSPKITLPSVVAPWTDPMETVVATSDTITKTDTIALAGYMVEIHDTIPCPAGLTKDSIIYTSFTKYLPGREVQKVVTIRDTIRAVSTRLGTTILPPSAGGWPERLAWLAGVLALLAALWKKWKGEQDKAVA